MTTAKVPLNNFIQASKYIPFDISKSVSSDILIKTIDDVLMSHCSAGCQPEELALIFHFSNGNSSNNKGISGRLHEIPDFSRIGCNNYCCSLSESKFLHSGSICSENDLK